jgi:CheY-like chemotaxis protein
MTTPPAGAPLRLVIADDQASVRQGLVLLLDAVPDIEVVGAAADGEQALDLVAEHHPDAILLDLHMPVLDGIGAIRRLTAEHPEVAIVVLSTYADDSSVLDALRAGARSYLTKQPHGQDPHQPDLRQDRVAGPRRRDRLRAPSQHRLTTRKSCLRGRCLDAQSQRQATSDPL